MSFRFALAPGLLLESLDQSWAAYSALSGETLILNHECAAILEVLQAGDATIDEVCAALSRDLGEPAPRLYEQVAAGWPSLLAAGLVTVAECPAR